MPLIQCVTPRLPRRDSFLLVVLETILVLNNATLEQMASEVAPSFVSVISQTYTSTVSVFKLLFIKSNSCIKQNVFQFI